MNNYVFNDVPACIEAEEAILGGILLDSEAIKRIVDTIKPEYFSLMAHQAIYKCALYLYQKKDLVDLMTVTQRLAVTKQLAGIGGQTKLAGLINKTVSAVNIDRYALILIDKYRRRKLIEIGYTLVSLGNDQHLELQDLEQLVKENFEEWLDPSMETSKITEPIEVSYQHSISVNNKTGNEADKRDNSNRCITESVNLKTVTNSVSKITELVTELKQRAKDSLEEQ